MTIDKLFAVIFDSVFECICKIDFQSCRINIDLMSKVQGKFLKGTYQKKKKPKRNASWSFHSNKFANHLSLTWKNEHTLLYIWAKCWRELLRRDMSFDIRMSIFRFESDNKRKYKIWRRIHTHTNNQRQHALSCCFKYNSKCSFKWRRQSQTIELCHCLSIFWSRTLLFFFCSFSFLSGGLNNFFEGYFRLFHFDMFEFFLVCAMMLTTISVASNHSSSFHFCRLLREIAHSFSIVHVSISFQFINLKR